MVVLPVPEDRPVVVPLVLDDEPVVVPPVLDDEPVVVLPVPEDRPVVVPPLLVADDPVVALLVTDDSPVVLPLVLDADELVVVLPMPEDRPVVVPPVLDADEPVVVLPVPEDTPVVVWPVAHDVDDALSVGQQPNSSQTMMPVNAVMLTIGDVELESCSTCSRVMLNVSTKFGAWSPRKASPPVVPGVNGCSNKSNEPHPCTPHASSFWTMIKANLDLTVLRSAWNKSMQAVSPGTNPVWLATASNETTEMDEMCTPPRSTMSTPFR